MERVAACDEDFGTRECVVKIYRIKERSHRRSVTKRGGGGVGNEEACKFRGTGTVTEAEKRPPER